MHRKLFASLRIFACLILLAFSEEAERVEAAACLAPPTNMISWWRFESNLLDAWDSNNGTAHSGPFYSAGEVGFGLSNSAVTVPDAPALHATTGMTVTAWINRSSLLTNFTTQLIVSKGDYPLTSPTATQTSFAFGLTNGGQLFFLATSNGVARLGTFLSTSNVLSTQRWFFVAATYDHTHLRLYLNGLQAVTRDFFNGIFSGTAPLTIGGSTNSDGGRFSGLIDEVALYNRALSEAELLAIYNADSAGLCLPLPVLSGPQSQTMPINEDATFSVSAVHAPPFTYQWRFNGANIPGATNSTLYVEHVQNKGNYSVAVSNLAGGVISSNAVLSVLPPLPCTAPPNDITSWWPADRSPDDVVGTNNALEGLVTPPFLLNIYATGKVGQAFATSVRILNSDSLNFGSNADFSWEGWIKLPPTNMADLFLTDTNVTFVDKFLGALGYAFGLRNGQLMVQLGFSGSVPPRTNTFIAPTSDLQDSRWHHVACTISRTLSNGSHLYLDGSNALTFDTSRFSGSLSNSSGLTLGITARVLDRLSAAALTDEMTLYHRALQPNEIAAIFNAGSSGKCKNPPVMVHDPQSITTTEGSNVTFTVLANGLGVKYQWLFNGGSIPGATATSLTLSNVTTANAGFYSVRVTNHFGAITSAIATLVVHQLPVAACTNVVVSADSTCTASASIDAGSFSPDGGPVSLSQAPLGPYPLGTNAVTLSVTDTNGVTVTCSGTVVVLDTTRPIITCPGSMILEFTDISGATASFSVSANDGCSPPVQISSTPASDSIFPIGTTSVKTSASDSAGNVAACSFSITVLGAEGVLSNVLAELTALRGAVTHPPEANFLDAAIQDVANSLEPSLWLDQIHITRSHGEQVFNDNKSAVQDLSHLLNQKHGSVDEATAQGLMNRIVKSDRLLAALAIQDALAAGVEPGKVDHANDELAQGDDESSNGQYEPGIAHYKNAGKFAVQQTIVISATIDRSKPVLKFEAAPGDAFVIETSTNLVDWTELQIVTADETGTVSFADDETALSSGARFYRAKQVVSAATRF